MANNIDKLYFSQHALSTYLTCQLKFRRRYLEELYWPRPTTKAIKLGSDFHAAAERYFLTGEEERYPDPLGPMLEKLYSFRPLESNNIFLPEQQLRLNTDIKLLAKYDLIVLADKAYIYDWKTDSKKIKKSYYQNSMQTIVYRYLLAAGGSGYWDGRVIKPKDVVMCYWNPNYSNQPLYLEYTDKRYKQDEVAIHSLISEIKARPWDEFLTAGDKRACSFCEYSPLCHGKPGSEEGNFEADDLSLSWDDIEEIPY